MHSVVTEDELEELVARAASGNTAAWRALWEDVEPWLEEVVSNPRFLGRVGQRDNDRLNIIVEIMARLHADDFARLKLFVETRRTNPQLKFKGWLRVLAKRVGIDYLRGHDDSIAPRGEPGVSNQDAVDIEGGDTALELLRYAAGTVPEPLLSALERWTEGASYDEIARELELESATAARELVRAAVERLRQRFRTESSNG